MNGEKIDWPHRIGMGAVAVFLGIAVAAWVSHLVFGVPT